VVYGGALLRTDRDDELVAVADGGQLNDAHTAMGLKSGPFGCRPAGLVAIVQPVDQGTRERLRLPTRAPPGTRRVTRAPLGSTQTRGTTTGNSPKLLPGVYADASSARGLFASDVLNAGWRPPSSTIAMRSAKAVAY
jgi:hypothetical protein